MSENRPRTFAAGFVPGALLGTGGGVLVGLLAAEPDGVGLFLVGAGALALALGVVARASAGSLDDTLGEYAGDREFGAAEARRTALRLAGLGVGLVVGGVVTWVVV